MLLLLAAVPGLGLAPVLAEQTFRSQDLAPSPLLNPSEVVSIQIEALRENSQRNEGIELTYRFASPGNKRSTGPLERFLAMVRSAPYQQLLNHRSARYGPSSVFGDKAYQLVTIIDKQGDEVAYLWVLSRQGEGEFAGCWMTDAVISSQRPVQGRVAGVLLGNGTA